MLNRTLYNCSYLHFYSVCQHAVSFDPNIVPYIRADVATQNLFPLRTQTGARLAVAYLRAAMSYASLVSSVLGVTDVHQVY